MREKKRDTQFRGRTWVWCICSGGAWIHAGGALCVAWHCFVLCSFADGVEPFCLTMRSRHFEHFVSVVLSHCPCLRGPRFALSSDLVLAFLWLLITCLSSLFISFLFLSFMNWWLCVLSMHSSRGRLRIGASEDRWMVAPWCDEWLTTWCGLILGRVLQEQVVAWFALVHVKSGRERP
jgi:hypothetical protein